MKLLLDRKDLLATLARKGGQDETDAGSRDSFDSSLHESKLTALFTFKSDINPRVAATVRVVTHAHSHSSLRVGTALQNITNTSMHLGLAALFPRRHTTSDLYVNAVGRCIGVPVMSEIMQHIRFNIPGHHHHHHSREDPFPTIDEQYIKSPSKSTGPALHHRSKYIISTTCSSPIS